MGRYVLEEEIRAAKKRYMVESLPPIDDDNYESSGESQYRSLTDTDDDEDGSFSEYSDEECPDISFDIDDCDGSSGEA
eukprot:CAMPEP_0181140984 /NCGR_PEP_ID=MMETSP1071-20121207/35588_1 /TAXON_ID=35127 /ORGANISM="Thalassiosira sp., Strain NH16" /LENGTH=77 /DNA_ID=CAMNT_0023227957 /DNA_START=674 /DNA_END=907 /DNA_ORIENTATION=-